MKYQPKAEIRGGKKQCRLCQEWLPTEQFGMFLNRPAANGERKRYINSRCKKCASKVSIQWGKDKRPELYAKWLKNKENWLEKIHQGYGGKCTCCGENNPLFLTIDHVNNDGFKERPRNKSGNYCSPFSGHYYARIIKENFPPHLQLLCWNCNCGKARNKGICPHKNQT